MHKTSPEKIELKNSMLIFLSLPKICIQIIFVRFCVFQLEKNPSNILKNTFYPKLKNFAYDFVTKKGYKNDMSKLELLKN